MYVWHKTKKNEFRFQNYRNSLEVPDFNLLTWKSFTRAFMNCQKYMSSLFNILKSNQMKVFISDTNMKQLETKSEAAGGTLTVVGYSRGWEPRPRKRGCIRLGTMSTDGGAMAPTTKEPSSVTGLKPQVEPSVSDWYHLQQHQNNTWFFKLVSHIELMRIMIVNIELNNYN